MKLPTLMPFGMLKKTLATSDAVAAEIARHDEQLAATRVAFDELEVERAAALLDATNAELDAIHLRGRAVAVALDRLHARRDALAGQLAELLEAEAIAGLTRRRAEAQARITAARKWLEGPYAALAREMVDGLNTITVVEAEVSAVNDALAAAGRYDEALGAVEPTQGRYNNDTSGIVIPVPTVAKLTRLVPIEGKAPGWGRVTHDEVWAASLGLL